MVVYSAHKSKEKRKNLLDIRGIMDRGYVDIVGVSQSSALEAILKANPKVIVDFYTDICVPCKIMKPVLEKVFADPKFKGVTLVFFDASNPDEVAPFGVRAVPTIIVFNSGSEVLRHVGTCSQDALAKKFDTVL